jgi:hypothetical protein
MKQEHRVAVEATIRVIMDITAENDLELVKKEALRSYLSGEGNQEVSFAVPNNVIYFPLLEEGASAPEGANQFGPTELPVDFEEVAELGLAEKVFGF